MTSSLASRRAVALRCVPSVLASIALLATAAPAAAEPGESSPQEQVQQTAGMRVYVDPETGEFAAPPADSAVAQQSSVSRRSRRAISVADSPVVGGGQTFDVYGRFLHSMNAKTNSQGYPEVVCEPVGEKAAEE